MISPRATWSALSVAVALGAAALLVQLRGLKRAARTVWRIAGDVPTRPKPAFPSQFAAGRARAIARVADRMVPMPRCLPRALLLAALLRRRGVAAELCLGTRVRGPFDAHAWVEIEGEPVNEADDLGTAYCTLWQISTLRT